MQSLDTLPDPPAAEMMTYDDYEEDDGSDSASEPDLDREKFKLAESQAKSTLEVDVTDSFSLAARILAL